MNEQTEQQEAIDLAFQGKSFFLTGAAGTGKTFTLNAIAKKLKSAGKKVGVAASTEIAAYHFDENMGACTLHKLAGVKNDGTVDGNGFKNIDVLVIDEISMIGRTLFETIEKTARKILNSDLPMGGIQVIGCGDFYQLAPVESSYCFESRKWRQVFPNFVILKTACRQDSLKFNNILNKVRIGDTTGVKEFIDANCKRTNSDDFIYLYAQQNEVDNKNKARLGLLTSPKIKYIARDTESYSALDTQHRAPEELELCVGCPVVVTHNINDHLYNRLRGKIVGFTGDQPTANQRYFIGCNELSCPIVEFNGKTKAVKPFQFKETFHGDCYREQIPLALNWAMTIHQAQGISLDSCNIDLKGAFQLGQIYVALSRIRDPRQMFVSNFSPRDVRISDTVEAYYEGLKPFKMLPGEELDEDDIFGVVKLIYYGVSDAGSSNVTGIHTGSNGDLDTEDVLMSGMPSNAPGNVNEDSNDSDGDSNGNSGGDSDGVNQSNTNIQSNHGVSESDDSHNDRSHSDGDSDGVSDGHNYRDGYIHSDHDVNQINAHSSGDSHSDIHTGNSLRNCRILRNFRKHSFSQRFGDMAVIDISDSDDNHKNETDRAGEDSNETYRSYFTGEADRERHTSMMAYDSQRHHTPIFFSDSKDDSEEDEREFTSRSMDPSRQRISNETLENLSRFMLGSSDSEDYF